MKSAPIEPAQVVFDHPERPGQAYAPAFGDIYHPRDGEFAQARHVFLHGNGLPGRWAGRDRFVILETGFGLGNNFLATWQAWRDDPARCGRLHFISLEKHPPRRELLAQAHAATSEPALAAALQAAWPPLVHGLHRLAFEGGRVELLLALGDAGTWLPEIVAQVDAFYLDGFSPARNPALWQTPLFKACAGRAAPGATAATWSLARSVREGLQAAGFEWQAAPGFGGRRSMTTARLRPLPRRPQPPGRRAAPACRKAVVIGAGLAGAAVAQALAAQGLAVTVLEQHPGPAAEASGNPAGLFHGVVHPQDGVHAQWLRAAALAAECCYRPLVQSGQVTGQIDGLLRGAGSVDGLQRLQAAQALPPDWVQACSVEEASRRAGCPVATAAWYLPGGGWLSPPELVRHWLGGPGLTLRTAAPVAKLQPHEGGWQALDAAGRLLAQGDVMVLANAAGAARLLHPWTDTATSWPLQRSRGQLTHLPPPLAQAWARPRLPLASGSYLVGLPDSLGGGLLCGATSQPGDEEPALRPEDHLSNLAQVSSLTGGSVPLLDMAEAARLPGRVGWRLATADRLPLVGPVPGRLALERSTAESTTAQAPRGLEAAVRLLGQEQPRHVDRLPGLYVMTALGSRGITWAPLLSQLLAAWVVGAPLPVPASLVDAVDPARFVSRAVRRGPRSARQADAGLAGPETGQPPGG